MAKVTRVTKAMAQARLADVPEDKRFWCCDGRVLLNLMELEVALREMSDEAFRYHSNEEKADFSNWVRDVIGDEKLSRDLQEECHSIRGRQECSRPHCLAEEQAMSVKHPLELGGEISLKL